MSSFKSKVEPVPIGFSFNVFSVIEASDMSDAATPFRPSFNSIFRAIETTKLFVAESR